MDKPTDLLRPAAGLVAVVFLLVGLAGFVPGLTSHVGDLQFAGHDSEARLLGLFEVSVLHNVVHVLFGIVGLALARTWDGARGFLLGGAAVYAVLTVYGAVIDQHGDANFVGLNTADNWLHLALAIGMAALGVVLARKPAAVPAHA